ncbi:MAG TPA: translocation/assembly module TamB domain-containing protein [Gemmatimonadaceae bacterium]|nr:translocation/assembly module TamB domain-containing protein [Gemmatimonadaceae bacterium]
MIRRRTVALASAALIFGIGVLVAAVVIGVTQTDFGRERVRRYLVSRIASSIKGRGSMYIGPIRGDLLGGVIIDSLAIRDEEDSLFLSASRVRVRYDPRDLVDKRILLSELEVEHPVVNLRRHADGSWNFKRLFPSGGPRATRELRFGDFIVADSVILRDGRVMLTLPWSPPDSLHGARRDSAIAAALGDTTIDVRRTAEGLKRTYRWSGLELRSPYVRFADPDSAGRLIAVGRMDVVESNPPFAFRNITGPVRILGDTLWFRFSHFDLPGSTGSGDGRIMWGMEGPVRYDVSVTGDSVSLRDVAWVYPTLPRTGGGSMHLHIGNDPRDPHILEYAIHDMDVRSTRSHLTGDMTFAVGAPVLIVKDVSLAGDPVNFDLLRVLNGGPFPVDWQGDLVGTVKGPGGPLTRWQVDAARFAFRDAHVPGAVSRATAHGQLDILDPGLTVFRGFDVQMDRLDLRTIEYLFSDFPRLGGTLSGSATLDSVWTDVRFRNADVTHQDGPGTPTRITGAGRITYGDRMAFDVDLAAQPLSFTTLARSYPVLPLRGAYAGTMRIRGTTDDLFLGGTLTGPAGTMTVDGTFDFLAPGLAGRGTGSVRNLNVAALLDRPTLPGTRITGDVAGVLRGDSLGDLAGQLAVVLDRSYVDSLLIYPSTAGLSVENGRAVVDSLRLETAAATLTATGSLGLVRHAGTADTLHYLVAVPDVAVLAPWMHGFRSASTAATDSARAVDDAREHPRGDSIAAVHADTAHLAARGATGGKGTVAGVRAASDTTRLALDAEDAGGDSLAGTLSVGGTVSGSLDSLALDGTLRARGVAVQRFSARGATGDFAFVGPPSALHGDANVEIDTARVGGARFTSIGAELRMPDRSSGRVHAETASPDGGTARTSFSFARVADTIAVRVDTLDATLDGHPWSLERIATILLRPGSTEIDSLLLHDGDGARFALAASLPDSGAISAAVRMDSVQLADLGALVQTGEQLGGRVQLRLDVAGTRLEPIMHLGATLADGQVNDMHFPLTQLEGRYASRALDVDAVLMREGRPALTMRGRLPVDLALASVPERLVGDSLDAEVRTDSVSLALLEALTPQIERATGALAADLRVTGTWDAPRVVGRLSVDDGEAGIPRLGIRLRRIAADLVLRDDSLIVRRLSAASGDEVDDTLALTGAIALGGERSGGTWFDPRGVDLTLVARQFQAVRSRRIADATLSGRLHLFGSSPGAHLEGAMAVDRGTIYLPERIQKDLLDVGDTLRFQLDTGEDWLDAGVGESTPPDSGFALLRNVVVDNVTIAIGDEVWLRSSEANVRLGGRVDVTRSGDRLALSGTLEANRGTYRLDLGLVQRTFQVDSGSVTFFGEPEINPGLDIWASYTVRQASRQDVRIRAHLGGTLNNIQLSLSSDERIPLSTTEILSYLVFGAPTFAVGQQNESALRPVATALLPTLGGVLEKALADQLSFFDIFQITTGAYDSEQDLTTGQRGRSVLSGSRIGVGKQLGDRTFVTANAGLCSLASNSNQSFTSALGLTVEHRLNHGYSVQLSVEPATQALLCRAGQADFATPAQFGVDLFREWSF